MKTTLATALGILSALSMTAGPAYSAGVTNPQEVNCLDLMRIDHTEVVDNQNILFYMLNGRIYLNKLLQPAPGLDRHDAFMYKTAIGQLCRLDTVTVLERWGFGLTAGGSSTLGKFMPVDEARAEALLSNK